MIGPIVEIVVTEQADVRHEDAGIHIDSVQSVEVIATIRFGDIAISIRQIATGRVPGLASLRGVVCEYMPNWVIKPAADVVIVKIAADAQLRELHFVGTKHFA